MPKFFFDVREGKAVRPDLVGDELPDLDAAENQASILAAILSRNRLPDPSKREVTIEVRNEHGQSVLTVIASLKVYRIHSSHYEAQAVSGSID